jgi:hypothetical protein
MLHLRLRDVLNTTWYILETPDRRYQHGRAYFVCSVRLCVLFALGDASSAARRRSAARAQKERAQREGGPLREPKEFPAPASGPY